MIGYKMACKVYGIKPLSKQEEENLSINEKTIRQCKIDIVNLCNEMRKTIDIVDSIAVNSEEKDDNDVVKTLVDLRTKVRNITNIMEDIKKENN